MSQSILSSLHNLIFVLIIASNTTIYTLSYTTLFRSHVGEDRPARGQAFDPAQRFGQAEVAWMRNALQGDRKSTRLNSSHRCISYAVFCLKKKICNMEFTLQSKIHIEKLMMLLVSND